jgi:Lrp/AsnC family transcriptional regulator, regulator for asnA, asnC and gidA
MYEIDNTDINIINLLMEDGRMPASEMARRIGGISERVIRYRIERIVKEGYIQISAITNPKSLGYAVTADVFLEVESGAILDVANKVSEYDCVSYVACSIGESDISVQVVGHDTNEVYQFVTEIIGKIPGVRKTTTSIVPLVLKDVYQWRIPKAACTSSNSMKNTTAKESKNGNTATQKSIDANEGIKIDSFGS